MEIDMKGYVIKYHDGRFGNDVYCTLRGIKIYLTTHFHYPKRITHKDWRDTLRDNKWEIWEVEITPKKKVI